MPCTCEQPVARAWAATNETTLVLCASSEVSAQAALEAITELSEVHNPAWIQIYIGFVNQSYQATATLGDA